MTRIAVSRRNLLVAGAYALVEGAGIPGWASARALTGPSMTSEEVIRKYYAAWEKKDWGPIDILLADSFTFTSANDDDHINKSVFKARCWESQIDFIERFELERIIANGNDAFVKHLCRTKNGKSFRNVSYFRFRDEKVEAIESYFGGKSSFASAVSTGQR
jgi:ketosteroid isomerase-like protein